MSKKGRDFFKWTCADAPAGTSGNHTPDGVAFTDLVDLGERTTGTSPSTATGPSSGSRDSTTDRWRPTLRAPPGSPLAS